MEWVAPSSSGLNFTNRIAPVLKDFYSIWYDESSLYVAVGQTGSLFTSPDGITWTSRTSGFGSNLIRSVAFGNGLWVAVGDNGTLTTSPDGITWTARTANMSTNSIRMVRYANSIWVAVGTGGGATNTGGIIYSTDGITWTRKSQTPTIGTTYLSVVYNGTNWIVGATPSTNNYLYASDPSSTWTEGATGSSELIYRIFWDGTRHITNEGSKMRFSTSVTLGTTTEYNIVYISSTAQGRNTMWVDSGKCYYTNGLYISYFDVTSNANTIQGTTTLLPNSLNDTGINTDVLNIWAGAAGLIISTTNGLIWTSF